MSRVELAEKMCLTRRVGSFSVCELDGPVPPELDAGVDSVPVPRKRYILHLIHQTSESLNERESSLYLSKPCPISLCDHHIRWAFQRLLAEFSGMGLWTLFEGFLLLANAFAVLNDDRFLARRGLNFSKFSGAKPKSLKGKLVGLIYAIQYLRMPLIALNALTIVIMLVSG